MCGLAVREGDDDFEGFDEGFEGDLEEEEEQECGGSENENRQNPVLLPPPTSLKARLHHQPYKSGKICCTQCEADLDLLQRGVVLLRG